MATNLERSLSKTSTIKKARRQSARRPNESLDRLVLDSPDQSPMQDNSVAVGSASFNVPVQETTFEMRQVSQVSWLMNQGIQ